MSSLHRICVMGRELQVRSSALPEEVRVIEEFVNTKLAEVASAIRGGSDPQLVAILTMMNIAEEHLSLVRGNETSRQHGRERLAMLLQEIDDKL